MNKKIFGGFIAAVTLACFFQACSPAGGDNPGHEYMPDMAHSVAYEANKLDEYSLHTWNEGSTRTVNQLWGTPRKPVKGTVARGYIGLTAHGNSADYAEMLQKGVFTPTNGSVPYYYADTEEERVRATKEIVMNPYPITKTGLEKGKELYKTYCGICHGDKAGGNGYLVRDDGKYPAQPANLLLDTFANGNNGRLYHAIVYGKNVMGGYTDKLSYEERWQVIHYIRSCQAAEKGAQYDEKWNTFKPTAAISDSMFQLSIAAKKSVAPKPSVTTKATTAPAPAGTPADPKHTEGGHTGH
jgi:mono/diheme cytochrome c family protein